MKTAPNGSARVEFEVRFPRATRRRRQVGARPEPRALRSAPPQVPKVTRLLVLGHHFERLVRDGVVRNYAEIARMTGLTRARMTQILDLTLLAPDVQEHLLLLQGTGERRRFMERSLHRLALQSVWRQIAHR